MHQPTQRPKVTISPQTQADFDEKTKWYQAWQSVQKGVTQAERETHFQVIKQNFGEDWLDDVKQRARKIWPKYNKREARQQNANQAKEQIQQYTQG